MCLRKITLSLYLLTIGSLSVALADQPTSLFNDHVAPQSYTVVGAKSTGNSASLLPSTTSLNPSEKQLFNAQPQVNSVINPDANGLQEAIMATQNLKKNLSQVANQQILFQQQMQIQVQQLQQENTMLTKAIQELYSKINAAQAQKTPQISDVSTVNRDVNVTHVSKDFTFNGYFEFLAGVFALSCLGLLGYALLRRGNKNTHSNSGAN